jgi:hypothetical protein
MPPDRSLRQRPDLLHRTFEIGLLLKGLYAAVELGTAALFWLVKPGTLDAGQQPDRADVGVLVEAAPDRDQQSPEGYVVGNPRIAHRSQEDRIEGPQLLEAVRGHHHPVAGVVFARPVEGLPALNLTNMM